VTRIAVLGAGGRMGRAVIEELAAASGAELATACDRPGSAAIGEEVAPGVVVGDEVAGALAAAEVYIDFTTPAATAQSARAARARGVAAVVGTTGLDEEAEAALAELSAVAPVLVAPNFSLGVNLVLGLAELAARALGPAFDLEVVEAHHRHKRDAPSGTAKALAAALAKGRGLDPDQASLCGREGEIGARQDGEIGVMALRGGSVVGDHTAYFFGPDERVEITHRAESRRIFAAGAVRAALWVAGQKPGRYGMRDVLGL
jgi:4-hydroxy-tetrahydrodipicolinate reductase